MLLRLLSPFSELTPTPPWSHVLQEVLTSWQQYLYFLLLTTRFFCSTLSFWLSCKYYAMPKTVSCTFVFDKHVERSNGLNVYHVISHSDNIGLVRKR